MVADREGYTDPDVVWLIFKDKTLNDTLDNKTLQDVGIEGDSTLFCVYRTKGGMEWKLNIRDIDGKIITL